MNREPFPILCLPKDSITEILYKLNLMDVFNMRRTCRSIMEICDNYNVWKRAFINYFLRSKKRKFLEAYHMYYIFDSLRMHVRTHCNEKPSNYIHEFISKYYNSTYKEIILPEEQIVISFE